jgi:hypothetical protein
MAVQTIPIDTDADELFARAKQPGQLSPTIIKRHIGPRKTAVALVRTLSALTLKEETLDAIKTHVKARRRHPARLPRR